MIEKHSISLSILIGALMISLSILFSSGVMQIDNGKIVFSSVNTTSSLHESGPALNPSPAPKRDLDLGHFPVKGSDSAKVAIVEFGDMRCPFCKQFFDVTEPQILSQYVNTGKVKFAFRNYQFLGPASTLAGNAIECANEQGKFWEYYDYLYKNQPDERDTSMYTSDKLTSVASNLGLAGTQFKTCLDQAKYSKNLTADMNAGQQVGITATPSFIIGKLDSSGKKIIDGKIIEGAQPFAAFQSIIDPLLQ